MKIDEVSEENIANVFMMGVDCGQFLFGYVAERVGISSDDALKLSSAFGGGMGRGCACGAFTSGFMALGLKYGHYREVDMYERRNTIIEKRAEYEKKFIEANGSVYCRDLLGLDVSKPEEFMLAQEKQLFFTVCPKFVCAACKIIDEMI